MTEVDQYTSQNFTRKIDCCYEQSNNKNEDAKNI